MTWFTSGGDYAAHRPTYPHEIADVLCAAAPDRRSAVDVGCGTGQLTVLLAEKFEHVVGLDSSADQIAHAAVATNVSYRVSPAYRDEIGPYWPPERRHVDSGYADLEFPFDPINAPAVTIERSWTAAEFIGYLGTWSAVRRSRDAGRADLLELAADDLARLWGDGRRSVRWPVTVLLGRL